MTEKLQYPTAKLRLMSTEELSQLNDEAYDLHQRIEKIIDEREA